MSRTRPGLSGTVGNKILCGTCLGNSSDRSPAPNSFATWTTSRAALTAFDFFTEAILAALILALTSSGVEAGGLLQRAIALRPHLPGSGLLHNGRITAGIFAILICQISTSLDAIPKPGSCQRQAGRRNRRAATVLGSHADSGRKRDSNAASRAHAG